MKTSKISKGIDKAFLIDKCKIVVNKSASRHVDVYEINNENELKYVTTIRSPDSTAESTKCRYDYKIASIVIFEANFFKIQSYLNFLIKIKI